MDTDPAMPSGAEINLGRGAFAEVAQWACERLEVGRIASDEVHRLAAAVDHLIGLGYQTGGLEVHHDGSERVDFLLHCNSRRTAFGDGVETPNWFDALIERTVDDDVTASEAMLPTPESSSGARPDIELPSQHWLEFDHGGDGLVLGGIWQAIVSRSDLDTASARSLLADAVSVTPIDTTALARSTRLASYIDHIGVPTQVGIMVGRSHSLKVFRRCDPQRRDDAVEFCSHPDLAETMSQLAAAGGFDTPESLITALEGIEYGINLDLDLSADRFPAGLGIELHLASVVGEGLSAELRALLEHGFGLDPAVVDDCDAIAALLPTGTSRRRSFGPFDQLVAPGLRHRVLVADLNHLKVVLRPDEPPTLKTYIRLSVYQGAESPTNSTPDTRASTDDATAMGTPR